MIALRHLADINPPTPEFDSAQDDTEVAFAPLEAVWADGRADHDRRVLKSAVKSGYTRYRAGDVLCPKVTPTFQAGRSMIARALGAGTTELHVLRAKEGVDPRFLCHAVRSKAFLDEGVAAFQGVAGLQRVPPEFVESFEVADLDGDEQRRIADFLDDQVTRIDSIIAARRRQVEVLTELESGVCLEALEQRGLPRPTSVESGWKERPGDSIFRITTLGRVLRQLTNGYVGPTRDILVNDGVPYIQSVHIKNGTIEFERRPFFVPVEWHDARPRTSLGAKDILIVQTGDIGRVAIVPEDFGPANCHALLIARTHEQVISPDYLFELLRSDFGYQAMVARATGALHPHLEASVRGTPVPVPQLSAQDEIAAEISQRRSEIVASVADFDRSIRLLTEFKQSLITAAVAGAFDVTTASQRVPA